MKKLTLLNHLEWGYKASMDANEFEDLRNKVLEYDEELNTEDEGILAEKLLKKFPQFQILHQSYMRERIEHIESSVEVIKVIVLTYFIASVIAGLLYWHNFG